MFKKPLYQKKNLNLVIHNLHNTLFLSYIIIYYNSDQKKSTLVNHITDLMIIKNTVQYFQAFGMKTGYTKCHVVAHVNEIQRAS